ncbi:carotenoid oxygenase family protein [Sphaerisporangium sp. NPDC051017]|uniref:carotenoid oxygenase family protein n=1 Tax=Sphaerisporangium sp. NPDC051017 TaxID=3154636 RepID=UPI0034368B47
MTVTEHAVPTVPAAAPARLPHDEPLRIDGVIPAELDGAFVQASPHPVGGDAILSGVRFSGGTARRLRTSSEDMPPLPPAPAMLISTAEKGWKGTGRSSVAPPVEDRVSGEWHTVATYPGYDHAVHLVLGPEGEVRAARPLALEGAPLMSAVALTERYVVVFDLPVVHDRATALVGSRFPYRWRPDRPARLGLLPRRPGGAPLWFAIDACHVSRVVNAYDDGGRVVVEGVRHDRAYAGGTDGMNGASADEAHVAVHRWTLDPATGRASERPLVDGLSAATVDARRAGRRHHLLFGVTAGGRALAAHDLAADSAQVREPAPGWTADRPVFVARGLGEGNGWIMAVTRNAALGRAALLVLDALNLSGAPQAVIHLPSMPPGAQVSWAAAPRSAHTAILRDVSTPIG